MYECIKASIGIVCFTICFCVLMKVAIVALKTSYWKGKEGKHV